MSANPFATWDQYHLTDSVEFPCPEGHTHVAGGQFVVYAPTRRQAHVTARLHLCQMLYESGLLGHARSESTDDLAE